jgi:excisionase family DNA binding protein
MQNQNFEQYYTIPEVAKILKKSKSFIYDMINQGKLEAIKISERGTRTYKSAIDKFIKQQMDITYSKPYNKSVVQPPKKGRKHNVTA